MSDIDAEMSSLSLAGSMTSKTQVSDIALHTGLKMQLMSQRAGWEDPLISHWRDMDQWLGYFDQTSAKKRSYNEVEMGDELLGPLMQYAKSRVDLKSKGL